MDTQPASNPTKEPGSGLNRLEDLYGVLQRVTAQPTWTPSGRFMDGLALDTNTGRLWYFDYNNLVWRNTGTRVPNQVSITTASSYTVNTDTYDMMSITALASAINTISASGTPGDGQKLLVRIKDNGTSRTLAWGAIFASYGAALPTSTTAGKVHTIKFIYDKLASLWGCVSAIVQP